MDKKKAFTSDETVNNPLVTIGLFSFNQENYIKSAVCGVLEQNYNPLEIIISDDCSTDGTFSAILAIVKNYNGKHIVRVQRNKENLGLAQHVSDVISKASGEIFILAAGDDISLPERTSITVEIFKKNQLASAVLLSGELIDNDGRYIRDIIIGNKNKSKIQTIDDLIKGKYITFGASRAIRIRPLKEFGPLHKNCPTEDTPLLLRSLIVGDNIISNKKGIKYRLHDKNLSSPSLMKEMNIEEIYLQYKSDISLALKKGFIDEAYEGKLLKWIEKDKKIRKIKTEIDAGKKIIFSYVAFMVFSASVGYKEKLKIIWQNLVVKL